MDGQTRVTTEQEPEIAHPAEDRVKRVVDGHVVHRAEKGLGQYERSHEGSESRPPPEQKQTKQDDQAVDRIGSLSAQQLLPWFAPVPGDVAMD